MQEKKELPSKKGKFSDKFLSFKVVDLNNNKNKRSLRNFPSVSTTQPDISLLVAVCISFVRIWKVLHFVSFSLKQHTLLGSQHCCCSIVTICSEQLLRGYVRLFSFPPVISLLLSSFESVYSVSFYKEMLSRLYDLINLSAERYFKILWVHVLVHYKRSVLSTENMLLLTTNPFDFFGWYMFRFQGLILSFGHPSRGTLPYWFNLTSKVRSNRRYSFKSTDCTYVSIRHTRLIKYQTVLLGCAVYFFFFTDHLTWLPSKDSPLGNNVE